MVGMCYSIEELKAVCEACALDAGISPEDLETSWQILDYRGALGGTVTFGRKRDTGGTPASLGLDLDPSTEALLIGVMANILTGLGKAGVSHARQWLARHDIREATVLSLGELGHNAKVSAEKVYDWALKNLEEFLATRRKRRRAPPDSQ